jgi:hypothetical protein
MPADDVFGTLAPPLLRRHGCGRVRILGASMTSAAVAVAVCAGCANEPDDTTAPPASTVPPTAVSRPDSPGGPLTQTVIVPQPEFTRGAEILRATLPTQPLR